MAWTRIVGGLAIGLAATLLTAELAVRVASPVPRTSVVRSDKVDDYRVVEGAPVWGRGRPPSGTGCATPGATSVVLVGSSILDGVSLSDADAPAARLAEALAPRPVCVSSVAAPAFAGQQKVATAQELVRDHRVPSIVLWEVWDGDIGRYVDVGGVAYGVSGYRTDADGIPGLVGWPGPVQATLFRTSALWRYATLALGGERLDDRAMADAWARYLDRDLGPAVEALRANGARVVLVVMPRLDRPFADTAASDRPALTRVRRWAEPRGVPVVDVAEGLVGVDVETVRLDACCHYDADGVLRLADVLAGVVAAATSTRDGVPGPSGGLPPEGD